MTNETKDTFAKIQADAFAIGFNQATKESRTQMRDEVNAAATFATGHAEFANEAADEDRTEQERDPVWVAWVNGRAGGFNVANANRK